MKAVSQCYDALVCSVIRRRGSGDKVSAEFSYIEHACSSALKELGGESRSREPARQAEGPREACAVVEADEEAGCMKEGQAGIGAERQVGSGMFHVDRGGS